MKVIVDMNLAVDWVTFLRERGHDCEHWSRIGNQDDDDSLLLDHCEKSDAVLLSADLDFSRILANRGSAKPSIIQLRALDQLPSALGKEVARALNATAYSLSRGAIVTVKPNSIRVKKLPIGNTDPY